MDFLNFKKQGIYLNFAIDELKRLLILGIRDSEKNEVLEPNRFFGALELHTTGENPDDHHGAKHTGGAPLYYKSHYETETEICFILENEKLRAKLIYNFFDNSKTISSKTEITNISNENIGIEYISSFCLYGINPVSVYLPHTAWCREFDWKEYSLSELGFNKINRFSTKRISVSNTGTWSTKEYLPMGIIKEKERTILWQIENNGSWNWEISDISGEIYLKLSGPSEQENGWWKELKPTESFTSVNVAIAVTSGDISEAIAEITKYRRHIAFQSKADEHLPVIFNDYMGCLDGDPTTEKELPQIDIAAKVGAEIFCIDAGWYSDGSWWETVGEWLPNEKRFPGGIKKVFDYIKSKGLISGIWLEPESVGIKSPILEIFDDSCFFMRHGKRIIDHGRYHLDFRNKKVTDYLNGVVDRLINDYDIGYFKFDYNIDGGFGTELYADSFGDGLMKHSAAYLDWIKGIYEHHPNIIIENCGSGGMRADYKTLQHFSLQSLTDAYSYKDILPIAAMSQTAVIPEQAAVWCVPRKSHSNEEIALSMVSAMFKRIHLSGETAWLNEEQLNLVVSGIEFYKSIRERIKNMTAFFPFGLCDFNSEWVVVGYTDKKDTYLCVTNLCGDETLDIPLSVPVNNAEAVYPINSGASLNPNKNGLTVKLPQKSAVVIKLN